MLSVAMVASLAMLGAAGPAGPPAAHYAWTPATAPQGEKAPELVAFRGGHALRFARGAGTHVALGQGEAGRLRLTEALTLAAVVQLAAEPPAKEAIVSKWRLEAGGRSYELGVMPSRQLYFTISASGAWPDRASQLVSTRALAVGVPCCVAATFEPGKRMALFINGAPCGELADGVPESVFDSPTPVLLGDRDGAEAGQCAFDGLIAGVWVHAAALDAKAVAAWAQGLGLTQPPEPGPPGEEPPYDLDLVKAETRKWYERLQAPGKPYGAYRLTPASPPDLYASADVAWIRWVMDDLDLTDEQRQEWIGFIQDQQDPADGSYRNLTSHCKTHAFCHATGALNMLGGKQRHRPRLLEPYMDVGRIPGWLDRIDWVRQWSASHDIWGAGVPLACTPATPEAWRTALFAWLDAEVDPATGFWRKGVQARSGLEYLGGAFHIWPIYAAVGHPIQYPQQVIDSVLKLQRPDGSFDGAFDYGNMDGVWALEFLNAQSPHPRDDVRAALERNLRGLMKLYRTAPGRFLGHAHNTESRIATLAILQAALPALLKSEKPWRNPWHRRELFVLSREDER